MTTAPAERWPHPITGEPFASPVPPATGWPGDPALVDTAVARTANDVTRMSSCVAALSDLDASVSMCRACPRLVSWRESVAVAKRASFATEPYWGRPIAGWGEEEPSVLVVGLAPAVHGGNRTGRIFTGDRSGDWLFAALHRAGLATQPTSVHAGDGQRLVATRMLAAVRCAPPGNKPDTSERDTCAAWLDAELRLVLPSARVAVALGAFAWNVLLRALDRLGHEVPRPRPAFGHRARVETARATGGEGPLFVVGSYHPSQQNTFTGRLTTQMLDEVFDDVTSLADLPRRES